jgi:hypothetical protein
MLEQALALARHGFWVFPIKPLEKTPPLVKFTKEATRDEATIRAWWARWPTANVGIFTGRYGDNESLLAVDIDCKGAKRGNDEILRLELEGKDFPETYTQTTPTGGRHLVYRVPAAVKQGANVLGSGLDIRSRGGFIVGAGSCIGGAKYVGTGGDVIRAPEWLVQSCAGAAPERSREIAVNVVPADFAAARAIKWLERSAPLAIQGAGGDETTFAVAAGVRDFGVGEADALQLLLEHWNDRCSPPWPVDQLQIKVRNAYAYAQNTPGSRSPENVFPPTPVVGPTVHVPQVLQASGDRADASGHLFAQFAEYAYLDSDEVLRDWVDEEGRRCVKYYSIAGFHNKFAPHEIVGDGGKVHKLSKEWMRWKERPNFEGVTFDPSGKTSPRFYNLWRGFSVEPVPKREAFEDTGDIFASDHPAVLQWIEHLWKNVCQNDNALASWLIGYFAHMVQRPHEKSLVALVFKGAKGVGKNALVSAVGDLLGGHYLVSSSRRYLVGNFNSHLENLLFFVLDEAFWSGDKQAEGVLKDLVTGTRHVIERKGQEIYTVRNLTRIAILGNEDWLVPASSDERRYAVFNVGDGRKQDRDYFSRLDAGMCDGGNAALLRYLLDYDIAGIDVNAAPASAGLLEQKHASLPPFEKWWLECLESGGIVGGEHADDWPETIRPERVKFALSAWARSSNIGSRLPSQLMKELNKVGLGEIGKVVRSGKEITKVYELPPLAECRAQWDKYVGQPVRWE